MKTKLFSLAVFFSAIILLFMISFAVADVISVNSGGSTGILINPATELEGFFSLANRMPVASNVILSSSSSLNLTNGNLTVTFTATDADGDKITNITDWRVNGNSIAVLNMPFDKNVAELTAGAVRDYSTYQNNGTIGGGVQANAPTWNKSCEVGGCYNFNGVNDYISNSSILSGIPSGNSNYTISAWINPKSMGTEGVIGWGKWGTQNATNAFRLTSTGLDNYWWGNDLIVTTGSLVGAWHYIVAEYNGKTRKIYLDGNLVGSDTPTGHNAILSNLRIGSTNNGEYFNGSIDEVQVYSRALSSAQIKEDYTEGLAHHQVTKLVSSETSKGDVWQVALTPDDKIIDGATVLSNTLTINDAAPNNPTNVKLVSLNGRNESNTNLNCSAYISDLDNSQLTVDVNWFRNGTSRLNQTFANQNNGTTFSTLLLHGNLTLGDTWYCSVRSYDGTKYSSWVNSNNLKIIDITPPNVTIISPRPINYTTLNVYFNVSATDNENVSRCLYSLDYGANVTMNRLNSTYFWYAPSLGPGPHHLTYYCNDTSDNWGTNSTNFTIENSAAISILLSDNLTNGVRWNVVSLPVNYLGAIGNNFNNATSYYINVSATNTLVDLYVKASGDLTDSALDTLGLGNETYSVNTTDPTVSGSPKITMSTNYTLIGNGLGGKSVVYMKFYLDAPSSQPAGVYTNNLSFVAVRHGQAP
jgi:hypothetical protein